MNKELPSIFWLDLSRETDPSTEFNKFVREFFVIRKHSDEIEDGRDYQFIHDAILFEYDYPDRAGLEILRKTKQQFPSLPIIMLTEQHSESLAIWALHARVFDYLVKPVSTEKIKKLSNALLELSQLRHLNKEQRQPLYRDEPIPYEVRIGTFIADANCVKRAANYIDNNLNKKIHCKQLADMCGMDNRKFGSAFKKAYGVPFQRYQFQRRIEEAARLLCHPDAPIGDIAYTVGFRDASYFARAFKDVVGSSPREYREIIHHNTFNLSPISLKEIDDKPYLEESTFKLVASH